MWVHMPLSGFIPSSKRPMLTILHSGRYFRDWNLDTARCDLPWWSALPSNTSPLNLMFHEDVWTGRNPEPDTNPHLRSYETKYRSRILRVCPGAGQESKWMVGGSSRLLEAGGYRSPAILPTKPYNDTEVRCFFPFVQPKYTHFVLIQITLAVYTIRSISYFIAQYYVLVLYYRRDKNHTTQVI